MNQKISFGIISILFIICVIFISGCVQTGCQTTDDCTTKTCFTAQCVDNTCEYFPIADCCGNEICETGEAYPDCSDCPNCDDNNECTKDSYDYDGKKCTYESIAPCYFRTIDLDPPTPEADYQIKIELSPSDFDYSKAKINGEDIRFFDESGNTLNYWIEDWTTGTSTIWVKVAESGTEEINMYYGHPDASSASTGSAVFEFFDDFDYNDESELTQVWDKHSNPIIELSDSIVTITASDEEHGGQHIYKNISSSTLLNNIIEIYAKRFSGYQNHMTNIGYISSSGGSIGDGNVWAVSRYAPSPDGSYLVFGGNHGGIASSPFDSFNIIKIYHQDGTSYAYEPPGTEVAEYTWPTMPPTGDYVLLGGQTAASGSGKASYDWIRIRKYASTEPSSTLGNEELVDEGTGPTYD